MDSIKVAARLIPATFVKRDNRFRVTRLLYVSIRADRLEEFAGYAEVRREVTYGPSRLDLVLEGGPDGGRCFIEAKSVSLVKDGVALFPDAPTQRGRHHLGELARAKAEGHRAAVVFVVQRDDATRFSPHDEADPAFGQALREAAQAGVEVYAYKCRVSEGEVTLNAPSLLCDIMVIKD